MRALCYAALYRRGPCTMPLCTMLRLCAALCYAALCYAGMD